MIIILGSVALLILGYVIMRARDNGMCDGAESILLISGVVGLALVIVAWPCFRLQCVSFVNVEYPTLIQTLEAARNNPDISPVELAAIQSSVLEANQTIADAKYWGKSSLMGWFYPKSIMRLEPVR